MQAFYSPDQALHHPSQFMRLGKLVPAPDLPSRAETLADALQQAGLTDRVDYAIMRDGVPPTCNVVSSASAIGVTFVMSGGQAHGDLRLTKNSRFAVLDREVDAHGVF